MKRKLFLPFLISFLAIGFLSEAQTTESVQTENSETEKIEVFYFHYARRCVSCTIVQEAAKKNIEELYPEQVKNKSITFSPINLEDEANHPLMKRAKVNSQALLVISGKKRADLTRSGFMFARTQPSLFKKELKETIDKMLIEQ